MADLNDANITRIKVLRLSEENGSMTVIEGQDLPFHVARVFAVSAGHGQVRGQHAHRRCLQLLSVIRGRVLVTMRSGNGSSLSVTLDTHSDAMLIPAMVWAEQTYLDAGSVLLVLCDHAYDEQDYIRDFDLFVSETKVAGL